MIITEQTNSSQRERMCYRSKANSVLSVSRRIMLPRSHVVNTPRGPEGPVSRAAALGRHKPAPVCCEVTLSLRQRGGWRAPPAARALCRVLVSAFFCFPGSALPKHVGRFQRVEIRPWSSGACGRAGQGRAGPAS